MPTNIEIKDLITVIPSSSDLIPISQNGNTRNATVTNIRDTDLRTEVENARNAQVDLNTRLKSDISDTLTRELDSVGYGAVSGLSVTAQSVPNSTVNVAGGILHMANGLRLTPIGNSSLIIATADTIKPRTDIIYVASDGTISYLQGLLGTQAVAGKVTYTITTNAVANDTITINGITFTAKSTGATGNQFNIGTTSTDTATNLVNALNENTVLNTKFVASSNTNVITLIEEIAGSGNTPTIASTSGIITITNSTIISSTPASSTTPSTPEGAFLLAEIKVNANTTSITNLNIIDRRKMMNTTDNLSNKVGDLSGLSTNNLADAVKQNITSLSTKANKTDLDTTNSNVTANTNAISTISTNIADTGWITATLINNWTGTLKYRKKSNVIFISIKSLIKTTADGTPCFILPSGFRPTETMIYSTITQNGSLQRIAVTNDGSILIQTYDGSYNKSNEYYNQIINY